MEIVVDYLFVHYQGRFYCIYIYSNRGDVWSFARENFMFYGITTVVFLLINSGGVFQLSVAGNGRFFPAVQTNSKFWNFIRIS